MTTIKEALTNLANEVGGLNFRQGEIIEAIGITNWDVLQLRLREAHAALADIEGAGKDALRNKIADMLLASVNAPEQEIYRVAREIAALSKPSPAPVGDIAGLVERLNYTASIRERHGFDGDVIAAECRQAAEALSRMEEREKELCEGLKPFASIAAHFDNYEVEGNKKSVMMCFDLLAIRRARNLLAGKESGK